MQFTIEIPDSLLDEGKLQLLYDLVSTSLTNEIVKYYKADEERIEKEILYGTGEGKPIGILNATTHSKDPQR